MLGFKAFDATQATLTGIELMSMLRKQQLEGRKEVGLTTPGTRRRWRPHASAGGRGTTSGPGHTTGASWLASSRVGSMTGSGVEPAVARPRVASARRRS